MTAPSSYAHQQRLREIIAAEEAKRAQDAERLDHAGLFAERATQGANRFTAGAGHLGGDVASWYQERSDITKGVLFFGVLLGGGYLAYRAIRAAPASGATAASSDPQALAGQVLAMLLKTGRANRNTDLISAFQRALKLPVNGRFDQNTRDTLIASGIADSALPAFDFENDGTLPSSTPSADSTPDAGTAAADSGSDAGSPQQDTSTGSGPEPGQAGYGVLASSQ